jgi:hypothetical protein
LSAGYPAQAVALRLLFDLLALSSSAAAMAAAVKPSRSRLPPDAQLTILFAM